MTPRCCGYGSIHAHRVRSAEPGPYLDCAGGDGDIPLESENVESDIAVFGGGFTWKPSGPPRGHKWVTSTRHPRTSGTPLSSELGWASAMQSGGDWQAIA